MISIAEIEKNKLDLRYQAQLQSFNAYLIAITTGVIGFAGTFIWFPDRKTVLIGSTLSFFAILGFFFLIQKTRKQMNSIMNELDSLKHSIAEEYGYQEIRKRRKR